MRAQVTRTRARRRTHDHPPPLTPRPWHDSVITSRHEPPRSRPALLWFSTTLRRGSGSSVGRGQPALRVPAWRSNAGPVDGPKESMVFPQKHGFPSTQAGALCAVSVRRYRAFTLQVEAAALLYCALQVSLPYLTVRRCLTRLYRSSTRLRMHNAGLLGLRHHPPVDVGGAKKKRFEPTPHTRTHVSTPHGSDDARGPVNRRCPSVNALGSVNRLCPSVNALGSVNGGHPPSTHVGPSTEATLRQRASVRQRRPPSVNARWSVDAHDPPLTGSSVNGGRTPITHRPPLTHKKRGN